MPTLTTLPRTHGQWPILAFKAREPSCEMGENELATERRKMMRSFSNCSVVGRPVSMGICAWCLNYRICSSTLQIEPRHELGQGPVSFFYYCALWTQAPTLDSAHEPCFQPRSSSTTCMLLSRLTCGYSPPGLPSPSPQSGALGGTRRLAWAIPAYPAISTWHHLHHSPQRS